ncbi:MAG: DNA polymerase III subunit gamma/tau [Chloroflexi bacterium]|nr:DNA polymerase III subunit gamma/tau [Chloroflexota bacterium]
MFPAAKEFVTSPVLYRKWRSQTFAELVGQEHITRTLLNALSTGRVAHAYVFCGPRGTGKTSTARLLAKAVNCLENGRGEPCGVCSMCQAITEGRAIDLIEIDAASHTGVDDVRELRERVNFAPNQSRFKVYIIDEVHMLSTAAFNALLKTLEEPPPHTIFVLATTEVHKIPLTILSRCQRFDFRRIPLSSLLDRLQHICQQEGFTITPEALELLAKNATGSLRDALNLLEQAVSYYGAQIELPMIQRLLGITADARLEEMAAHVLSRNLTEGLNTINQVASDGVDLRQFSRELVEYFRHLLLAKANASSLIDATPETLQEIQKAAEKVSAPELLLAIKLFHQVDFRFDAHSPLPFELALTEYVLQNTGESLPDYQPAPPREAFREKKASAGPKAVPSLQETENNAPSGFPAEVVGKLAADWAEILTAMRKSNKVIEALLRSCKPLALEDNAVVLECYHLYHKQKVEDPKNLKLVEEVIARVMGNRYQVRCVLAPQKEKKAAANDPLVRIAVNEYGARIVESQ